MLGASLFFAGQARATHVFAEFTEFSNDMTSASPDGMSWLRFDAGPPATNTNLDLQTDFLQLEAAMVGEDFTSAGKARVSDAEAVLQFSSTIPNRPGPCSENLLGGCDGIIYELGNQSGPQSVTYSIGGVPFTVLNSAMFDTGMTVDGFIVFAALVDLDDLGTVAGGVFNEISILGTTFSDVSGAALPVPEPSTGLLLGVGVLGAVLRRGRSSG